LALSCKELDRIGMERIAEHERELTRYTLMKLLEISGMDILGTKDPQFTSDRLGVITFNLEGFHHHLLASILGYEHAIGVRAGCFCAHPYMLKLLGIKDEEADEIRSEIQRHDKRRVPGGVRLSLGIYNNAEDINTALESLKQINAGNHSGLYRQITSTGEFVVDSFDITHPRNLVL
jgi:selenocysteine lyase/cysteine desulfurase